MATEFQRACQALERLQESLATLVPEEAEDPSWVLLATCGAAERSISARSPTSRGVSAQEEERRAFVEAEEKRLGVERWPQNLPRGWRSFR